LNYDNIISSSIC